MISLLDQIILLLNTNYQQDLKEESEAGGFFPWLIHLKAQC